MVGARHALEAAANRDCAGGKVDVIPRDAEDLGASCPRYGRQQHRNLPDRVLRGCDEGGELVWRKDRAHMPGRELGNLQTTDYGYDLATK